MNDQSGPAVDGRGSTAPLTAYWLGNIAKTRIIGEILADPRLTITVLDYGAGSGGDWPMILGDHPKLRLLCFEPHAGAATKLRERLQGFNALVLDAAGLRGQASVADYIVSFSVFEHVYDRKSYLAAAKRCLAPSGVFHLNYDDGHFRNSLDLDQFRDWKNTIAEVAQNRLAKIWPRIGRIDLYQSRVDGMSVRRMIEDQGFRIAGSRYENLLAFKSLFKTMPREQQAPFTAFWLSVENELNARFAHDVAPTRGDAANLWREMASRTLKLMHA